MQEEPVVIINAVIAVIEAAVLLAVGFGLEWTTEQVAQVMALVLALGVVVQTLWARSKVTPTHKPKDEDW